MEIMNGPFGEHLFFKKSGIKSLLKKKDYYFFVDDFFKSHEAFKSTQNVCFLKAGEKLKDFKSLDLSVKWLVDNGVTKNATIVAVGGGSIGDSIGFLASIYLRGVNFIQVPTTWLAAVDSAVGGKTALNYKGYKNQIGTVYAPKEIYFFNDLLSTSRIEDSEGEIIKTLLLNFNKAWAKRILQNWSNEKISFRYLQKFVLYKTAIVKKDKDDTNGIRAVLNLGHTVGHALELKFKLSHSDAVKKGLLFAVRWSYKKKHLSLEALKLVESVLGESLPEIDRVDLISAVAKDKKSSGERVKFIFSGLKGPIVKAVKVSDLADEYQRQVTSEF